MSIFIGFCRIGPKRKVFNRVEKVNYRLFKNNDKYIMDRPEDVGSN